MSIIDLYVFFYISLFFLLLLSRSLSLTVLLYLFRLFRPFSSFYLFCLLFPLMLLFLFLCRSFLHSVSLSLTDSSSLSPSDSFPLSSQFSLFFLSSYLLDCPLRSRQLASTDCPIRRSDSQTIKSL